MAWEPTQDYVLDLKGDLEGRYQGRNDRIDSWRSMLRDDVDIQVPEAYRTTTQDIRLGLPRIWVRRTVVRPRRVVATVIARHAGRGHIEITNCGAEKK